MMQPSKKMKRMENKKKKMAALLEITELNNKERSEFETSQPGGPAGDYSTQSSQIDSNIELTEISTNNNGIEREDGEMVEESPIDHEDGGRSSSSPHKKKKRKVKHQDECNELETKRKKHSKYNYKGDYEEWPSLVPDSDKEKKTKTIFETQTEDHNSVKNHNEEYFKPTFDGRSKRLSSFTDELEHFKKDIKRSKRKKEKKQKKDVPVSESAAPEHTGPSSLTDDGVQKKAGEDEEPADQNEEDELAELRRLLRLKKKQLKEFPMVRLKGVGKEADLDRFAEGVSRTPILPCDVQLFLMFTQLGEDCPRPRGPSWIELKKCQKLSQTVVLLVEGLSAYDYFSCESNCPNLKAMDIKAEMVSPYLYNANIIEELCAVALTKKQRRDLEKRFGKEICPEALQTDRVIKVLRSAFSITSVPRTNAEQVEQKIAVPKGDKFPRTDLLLSVWQLIEEGYPLPYGKDELGNRYPDYMMTKDQYAEVTPSSPMWALDCEMCLTRAGNELTRVSVIDEKHKLVYESLCLPYNPIKNYLTEYSGITPEMMKGVTTRLEDVQRDLRELFPADVILVGQSLNGDLHALKMMHPYIIDTSVIYNLTGNRKHKSKLSKLSMEFLNEAIQQRGADGHDSVEDSLAALKLVQHKLTKSLEYGDAVLSGLQDNNDSRVMNTSLNTSLAEHGADEFDDIKIEVGPTMATSLFKHFTMNKRTVTLISQEDILAEYATFVAAAHRENKQLVKTVGADSNSDIVIKTCAESKNNHFTLAHMMLNEEDDIGLVDTWLKMVMDCASANSLFVTIFAGSHKNLSNGACFVKVKKPPLKHLPSRTRLAV